MIVDPPDLLQKVKVKTEASEDAPPIKVEKPPARILRKRERPSPDKHEKKTKTMKIERTPIPSKVEETKNIPEELKKRLYFIKKNFKDVQLGVMMVRANLERLRIAIEKLEKELS